MPTSHRPPPPADANRPARGRNRVDPVQLDQLHAAVDHAGQGPYPAGSLLPPHPNPGDRWPLLGAPLSARAWQVGLWLTAPTHTGRGALPVLARREVARFLDEQGLAPPLIPQDVMRILASLAREPGAGDEPLPDATLGVMLRAMKNDRRYAARPGGSMEGGSRAHLTKTRRVIKADAMPALWGRYALRVVMHALALSLEDRTSLWLLRQALCRAADDVTLAALPAQAPAASMLCRSWGQLLEQLLPASGEPPRSSEWEDVKALWCEQEQLFNPLLHTDSADPIHVRDWMAAELADASQRQDASLVQRLAVWPARLPDQVHAWAWAVARELMDGTRYGDFGLHAPVRLHVALAEGDGPEQGAPNALHHLAVCFKQKRASGPRLHRLPNAVLYRACRAAHHTHFRVMADHPPLDGLATPEAGRKLATGS